METLIVVPGLIAGKSLPSIVTVILPLIGIENWFGGAREILHTGALFFCGGVPCLCGRTQMTGDTAGFLLLLVTAQSTTTVFTFLENCITLGLASMKRSLSSGTGAG